MRILIANSGHPATIKGGAEAAALDLAHGLSERGHGVSLVVHHPGRGHETWDDGGVRVHALPNRNLYFGFDGRPHAAPARLAWHALDGANPFMAAAFGRILDAERPDIVNTHALPGLSQLVWREARRRGLPVVHYLHEYGTMCPRGSGFRDGRLCERPCTPCAWLTRPRKALSRLVDTVVGVSRFTLDRHLAWGFFPHARTEVLPNLFRDFHRPAGPRRGAAELRLGYFGRLIHDKGVSLLIEAVRRLPPQGWTLDIGGTGDPAFVDALKAAAPANVRFLGWTRAADFFPCIDLLIVPSIWPDPQPRGVFESYMHGVPVAGARSGGIPEQIDEGRTGWLFDPTPESLAALLSARLGTRDDRAISADALARRLERLEPGRVIESYEAVFEAAIARRRAAA
ncbi:glycosyltransferase family 4 protein [Salinarimonas soli]|nr:glycosyltransferase family 4 protein [Salinarimonas soli]